MTDRGGDRTPRHPPHPVDDDPVIPEVPEHESDGAWGDEPARRGADWYRRERPPHHE